MDPLDVRRTRPARTNLVQPLQETASQTAGPYVHIGCLPNTAGVEGVFAQDLVASTAPETRGVTIFGHVFDGGGEPCRDAMLEFWQADSRGDYEHGLWHRAGTDPDSGRYRIETIVPGASADAKGRRLAPQIAVWIVARGINLGLFTRIYFEDAADDPHLALVAPERRPTLLATQEEGGYRFDIRLQGKNETVFFDV